MPTTYPIIKGNQYFDATTYTGTGGTQSIVNAGGFSPDFVWIKERSSTSSNTLSDVVRGAGNILISNSTDAEATGQVALTSFNTNGFTVGDDGKTNESGQTYVGWQWRASDSAPVTNTAGSVTSTVSANTTSGFSVVTWTGNGTAGATIGHGLSSTPKLIFVKRRSSTENWAGYHASLGATKAIFLNLSIAALDDFIWDNTAPTSTVFSVGGGVIVNGSGSTYVAYCWSEVPGFSKFDSYTGNGSADGTFVYTGFRPEFVMVKRSNSGSDSWWILDASRSPYNAAYNRLRANVADAESSNVPVCDFVSNGFKLRDSDTAWNASGSTYIYMAFAEMPTKYANAR